MGAADGQNNNDAGKKGDNNSTTVVLKVDMHCDGCASKIIRHLRSIQGVEKVKAESGKLTVTGNVDPTNLRDSLAEKIKKKVEIISPQLKKENKDTKINDKSEKKIEDTKPKDNETGTTAVLKVALHCQGCLDKIGKTVLKTKGVQEMAIDKDKETITVRGKMDVKGLVENLMEKLKRKVEVVPPKKNKEEEGEGEGKIQQLVQPTTPFGFGYNGYGNNYYGPIYPEQFQYLHLYSQPPPQMFSDENPNACSVM